MASYYDDHSLEDPFKARAAKRNNGTSFNPDLSHFMPREDDESNQDQSARSPSASGPGANDFRRLADMLGAFRVREEPLGDEEHQEFLDNLITQLMDEAGASGKHGPPPASKSFIRDLPYVPHKDVKRDEACIICNENLQENETKAGITSLPCKHFFDRDCIVPWLELHNNCPACRAEVPSDDPEWIKKKREAELAKYAAEAEVDENWILAHASTLMNMPSKELIHPVEDLIQSALMAPVENDYPNSEVVFFLKALAERESDQSHVKVTSMIVDLLWMMEIENEFVTAAQKERMILLTKDIIAQGFIPVRMMKERWEIEFLEEVGLIPNAKMFLKRVVRINTAQLYKQQKYNLLREESEGYSKLITELSTGTADSDDVMEISSKVDAVLTNIISLIGYFDLDPNRVLDIALDVFAANVATHHQFFIDFLRKSPWNSQSGLQGIAIRNRACAQVLGFKFQILQRPEHRHKSPVELYTVAALLLKHSIVHMEDIYPHLSLSDEVMEKEYAAFKSAMKDKANSLKSNPLAMAGALVDDTVVGASSVSSVKDQAMTDTTHAEAVPELPLPNQKVGVVNALLSIGDLENAMFLFARFPNLTASYPETADLLCRLIHVMIQNVYAPFSPATCHKPLAKDRSASYRHPPIIKDREVAVVRVLSPNVPLATSTQRFEFFYQGWKDNITCCQSVADLVEQTRPLLNVVGVRIHRDTILVTKLCRIGAGTMSRLRMEITQREKTSSDSHDGERSGTYNAKLSSLKSELQHVENAWVEMAGSLFLPSMSLTYSNPGLVNEVWQVLKGLRYEDRYSLYGFWKGTAPNRYPELQVVTAATEKEAKSVMRRINKEDVKQYGRMFAKYAHSNPQIVFAAAMKQLEGGYDNMVQPLVDACKYLTDMGQDVLTYALLESLSKTTRSKVQDDGTSPAKWMITLSSFSGQLYRKYNSPDLSGILQYIVNQLRISSVNDLVVLRELLAKMGGIEETSNLNSSQLLAMAGGDLLKNETLFGGVAGTVMKKNGRSCLRLQEAMMRDNIASQLLVLLAQHRQMSIFGDNMVSHLKLLSNLFDQAHTTLLQFLEFLSTNLHKEYPSFVPSLTELCREYNIESNIAMCVIRPKLQELILKEQRLKAVNKLKADDKQSAEATPASDSSSAMDVDGQEAKIKDESANAAPVWLPSLEPIAEEVTNILPPRALRGLKPHFFVTFWQLTLYDIFVPVDQYKAEIAKLKHTAHVMDSDRTAYSSSVQAKRGRDRDRLLHAATRLDKEMENQLANHKRVMERLHRESQHWFRN
ncbi:THO complex subunit 2, partial [Mortierella antarctica]